MKLPIAIALLLTAPLGSTEIVTREVTYEAGQVTAKGFLATPAGGQKHPGVLVVHEWWGQNDYVRKRARMLAELGYTALAVDMYGEGQASDDLRTAAGFAARIAGNQSEMKARFRAAMKFLQAQEETEPDKIAAVGYGFGGHVVLQMARNGQRNLSGVASFHAPLNLRPPNPPAKVSAKVLVCNGGEDPLVRPGQVDAFKKDMAAAEADLRFINYPDSFQGFTNPGSTALGEKFSFSLLYDPKADRASWSELEAFLTELFSPAQDDGTQSGEADATGPNANIDKSPSPAAPQK